MDDKRDSFIFYRSFFEALKNLKQGDRVKVYDAICNLALNLNESELIGVPQAIFTLIKPQIEANNKKWANGCKPKPKQDQSKAEAKRKQNESKHEANNDESISKTEGNENEECRMNNVNVNVNENENVKAPYLNNSACDDLLPEEKELMKIENWLDDVNLFTTLENAFGRPLSQPETERLAKWNTEFSKEHIYNAIREADLYQKKSMDYIDRILIAWKQENRKFEQES